ncbi:MAG: repeat-containing protein [Acidobacteria bacterium]|nr:repeat-containing protein [Acidobacteriota bacterium]
MQRADLAARLVDSSDAEREALLEEYRALADIGLAYALKDLCYEAFTVEPAGSVQAAAVLKQLSQQTDEEEISALADWVGGIADLVEGQMENAIFHLDSAAARLVLLGKDHTAATTQVSKLIALAMLGRYDEAIECGRRALAVFLLHNDLLSAGRIENNIGNLCFRRERYNEAEEFQSTARERFLALNVDQKQLAIINNCLANTHAVLHRFKSAENLYEQALQQAESASLPVTLAEIEGNIGNFALLQGRYDRAPDYLERSRRRYASLEMPHQSTIAEQEIADAYLELNLVLEAAEIYERIIPTFADLGMRAEQARALACNGRALLLLGRLPEASALLIEARRLYEGEGNEVGAAMAALSQAQLDYRLGNYAQAAQTAGEAEPRLVRSGSWRRLLLARWLRGEAERAQGHIEQAKAVLDETLLEAEQSEQPQVAERCYTSLGLLASSIGDAAQAEQAFKNAVALTEELRAPLPGEEFRAAYFSDKLIPYNELVRLCLSSEARTAEALGYVERARARALVETIGGGLGLQAEPRDDFEAELFSRLETLRQELNYFYNQINRPASGTQPGKQEVAAAQKELRERERKTSEIMRQLQHRGEKTFDPVATFDVAALQADLGSHTALVEYTTLDDELLAFLITDSTVEVIRDLASETEVTRELGQFRFQIDALRYGAKRMRRHLTDLTKRSQRHLEGLYDDLVRPIEDRLGRRRLVIVPHRALHYLPFQALYDGRTYLIERREVSYAPSAVVLQQCLRRQKQVLRKALLLGVADERIPRVHEEIKALAPLFPEAVALLDHEATLTALRREAPAADVIHLACHGQFRPDNPLFSSLQLGDGWLTVRDAYNLNLHCGLVTLSACETGVSTIAPGDELLGLARGFFAAGAPSLLLSLWTVDDDATEQLMSEFYTSLRESGSPASALRHAQLRLMESKPHPFFWSPFVLLGRW